MGWGVFQTTAQFAYRDRKTIDVEFTGANGSISLVKSKGFVSVAYVSEGLYRLTVLKADGTALKGMHLRSLTFTPILPALAADGGWINIMTLNTLNTLGIIEFSTLSSAAPNVVADVIGVFKLTLVITSEAAS